MAQFKALSDSVEVDGKTLLSIVDGMGAFKVKALKILAENGIINPKPGKWYSQQAWLNAFKVIAEDIGAETLYTVGTKIPKYAKWPPGIENVEQALASIDTAYHINHRGGGEIGGYKFQQTGEGEGEMVCDSPFPCDFDRGVIEAVAQKFSSSAKVVHDDNKPCRNKNGDLCVYKITWK